MCLTSPLVENTLDRSQSFTEVFSSVSKIILKILRLGVCLNIKLHYLFTYSINFICCTSALLKALGIVVNKTESLLLCGLAGFSK